MTKKDIVESQSSEQPMLLAAFKDLEQRFEEMFQRFWKANPVQGSTPELFSGETLFELPKMDVVDRDKEVYIKAELPGFEKKDLDVSIANDQLVIKAKSSHEEKHEEGDYLKQEISRNEIYRSVPLPAEVEDTSKVKTSFKNGVLELTIPKQKRAHRKRIEVK